MPYHATPNFLGYQRQLGYEVSELETLVTLRALAEEIGMGRSHLRGYVLSLGIEPQRVRTPESRNQPTLAITASEADYVRSERDRSGFTGHGKPIVGGSSYGEFYVVQLEPELLPQRLKFGFSASAQSRLTDYRSSNPGAMMLKSWPAKRAWEEAIIAVLSAHRHCKLVGGEVYDCSDIDSLLKRGDHLMTLFPVPNE